MSDYLSIRLYDNDLQPWSIVGWAVISPTAQIQAAGQSLLKDVQSELPESAQLHRCIVIVPGESVLLKIADIAASQQRHLRQVLPFVVEEFIIDPIESMHLASPIVHSGSEVAVACVKRSLMRHWIDTLAEADIQPDYMFADVLCVPLQKPGDWSVLIDGDKALFRDSENSGIALNSFNAESVLRIAINHVQQSHDSDDEDMGAEAHVRLPETISLISVANNDEQRTQQLYQEAQLLKVHAEQGEQVSLSEFDEKAATAEANTETAQHDSTEIATEQSGLESPAQIGDFVEQLDRYIRSENLDTENRRYTETADQFLMISAVQALDNGLNLLQGDYRAVSANAEKKQFLRKLSLGAAACVGLFLVCALGGGWYLNYRADNYFNKSVAVYRDLFPQQRRVFDPVKQMKNRLSGGSLAGVQSDFLPLLDAASKSLASLETDQNTTATITQLRYDTQRGQIAIDIQASNIDHLEVYRDLLLGEGLQVDILSANRDGEMINGRLQIGRS
jgi:type II secretion system protein L